MLLLPAASSQTARIPSHSRDKAGHRREGLPLRELAENWAVLSTAPGKLSISVVLETGDGPSGRTHVIRRRAGRPVALQLLLLLLVLAGLGRVLPHN